MQKSQIVWLRYFAKPLEPGSRTADWRRLVGPANPSSEPVQKESVCRSTTFSLSWNKISSGNGTQRPALGIREGDVK